MHAKNTNFTFPSRLFSDFYFLLKDVLVLGAGPIGLLSVQIAKSMGKFTIMQWESTNMRLR